ncbi:FDLD family class I lanthipeptide [Ktedonosporobacter rubrisoli]|uniref:FDLD family class I lanthipeptide n=1 Tax=Ktedonosporobacter rubrisoli TaxID=2509675 RepID=UPI001A924029
MENRDEERARREEEGKERLFDLDVRVEIRDARSSEAEVVTHSCGGGCRTFLG